MNDEYVTLLAMHLDGGSGRPIMFQSQAQFLEYNLLCLIGQQIGHIFSKNKVFIEMKNIVSNKFTGISIRFALLLKVQENSMLSF